MLQMFIQLFKNPKSVTDHESYEQQHIYLSQKSEVRIIPRSHSIMTNNINFSILKKNNINFYFTQLLYDYLN